MSYVALRPLGLAPEPMGFRTTLIWLGIIGAAIWIFRGSMRPAGKRS